MPVSGTGYQRGALSSTQGSGSGTTLIRFAWRWGWLVAIFAVAGVVLWRRSRSRADSLRHGCGRARRPDPRRHRNRHGQPCRHGASGHLRLRSDRQALLRLQHRGQKGPDLRQDRSAALPDHGRTGARQSRQRSRAVEKGSGEPRLRPARVPAQSVAVEGKRRVTGYASTAPAVPPTRRQRRSSWTGPTSSNSRRRSTRPRSISGTPISSRRSTAPWSCATSTSARPWPPAFRLPRCS